MNEATSTLNSIIICMGSSCFSRGNNRNIEVIQESLARMTLGGKVELTGHLCEGLCRQGPNVSINGEMYHEVCPSVIIGLLKQYGNGVIQ